MMPKYVKYRGAARVAVTVVGHVKRGGKDMVKLRPRSDFRHAGEGEFIYRSPDKVYTSSSPIPRRTKK